MKGHEGRERTYCCKLALSFIYFEQALPRSLMVCGGSGNCTVSGNWVIHFPSLLWVGCPPEAIRQDEVGSLDEDLILSYLNLRSFSPSCFITVVAMLLFRKKNKTNTGPQFLSVACFNHFFMIRRGCRYKENMMLLLDTSGVNAGCPHECDERVVRSPTCGGAQVFPSASRGSLLSCAGSTDSPWYTPHIFLLEFSSCCIT